VDFRLLGPLEVVAGGARLPFAAGKQRALLAILLLNANRTVGRDQIVDDLWGEDVPESARKMVQIHVSQLRKAFPEERVHTRPPGYVLEVGEDELDLGRFERLVADGRQALAQGNPAEAAELLTDAVALWRGPALAEFSEPFARHESARLEELRLAALEWRVEADLALGRHGDVVGELETLIGRHPLRERLRAQHMLALYRSGRHAEALESYRTFRQALDVELGIEPTSTLKELERRILQQDETLGAPEPQVAGRSFPAPASPAPASAPPPSARRIPSLGSRPEVHYAKSGDLNVAYQVTGGGAVDVVLVSGFVSHLEKDWEEPRHAHFLERLGEISRLIRFDKRGTGLSDRPPGLPDPEARMDDIRAVMDATRSERAVLFGYSEGAPLSILFAATYPERVRALVLYGAYAKRLDPDDDYPWAPRREARQRYVEQLEQSWGFENDMQIMCPSADEEMARWWGERCRADASPGAVRALIEMNSLIDVRAILPAIHVPTLVVHRGTDFDARVEEGRYIAERIAGARFVELPGADHFVAVDADQILDVVEPFVAEVAGVPTRGARDSRVLATILVTDVVGSTELVARLGDRDWASLVARHEAAIREELARFSGEEIDTAGDGFLALFDGPARAIRCALAVRNRADELGLALRIGLHTGEIERQGAKARGIAVHVAARVAAEAAPGEVYVTATTRDIVAGSGLEFEDLGERRLRGIDEPRRLFSARHDERTGAGTSTGATGLGSRTGSPSLPAVSG
jgi:DNA-binding SARP family transcriptional activator/class 3 adenylate cyclase